jgi:hypothetical protein
LLNDLHAALQGGALDFGGIGTNGLIGHLDELSIFLNWVLFLVFAFSRWPVSGPQYARTPDGPRPPDALREGPGPTPTAPLPSARPARVVPSSGAGPGSGPTGVPSATVAKRPAAQFCPWCAEALPGNRALFHDCGSKDRPESFCKNCGTALPDGSSVCNACGVS